jgi:hypothetical protein
LDEIQYAPGLLPSTKERIDGNRREKGQYVLSGSQNLLLMEAVMESLACCAAVLTLLPLTQAEIEGRPGKPLPRDTAGGGGRRTAQGRKPREPWDVILRGGYPELAADPGRDGFLWHASYVQTYLEREVRNLRKIGELSRFRDFLRVLASRSGQILNLQDVSRSVGISVNTGKAWLSVLEATYQVILLRPYYANLGKRLTKRPKLYFLDTGVLCHLLGFGKRQDLARSTLAEEVFETAVVADVFKRIAHRGLQPRLFFWRPQSGREVDLLVERGEAPRKKGSDTRKVSQIAAVEVKLTQTPRPGLAEGIQELRTALGEEMGPAYVVHPGDARLPLGSGVSAVPFSEV